MAYVLGTTSRQRLEGVHPDLVRVVERAIEITDVDFAVVEGPRTLERQRRLLKAGASTTMNSRHLSHGPQQLAHAVDLVAYIDGHWCWDWPLADKVAKAMKRAAQELGIPIEWGGDWVTFKDGPHFQLPWKQYP